MLEFMSISSSFESMSYQTEKNFAMSDRIQAVCRQPQSDPFLPNDILCGRDKQSHAHIGNKRFRKLVMMYRHEYQTAPSREHKTIITCKIVATVQAYGGRFLKQDEISGEWKDVDETYAREKVSHALRSAKDPNRPKIKKRREVKKHIPTAEEDILFETTFADQQRIFQRLISKETKGMVSEIDFEDLGSLLSDL